MTFKICRYYKKRLTGCSKFRERKLLSPFPMHPNRIRLSMLIFPSSYILITNANVGNETFTLMMIFFMSKKWIISSLPSFLMNFTFLVFYILPYPVGVCREYRIIHQAMSNSLPPSTVQKT